MDEKPVNNNNLQFKRPAHQTTEPMKEVLFRLATKQLKPSDWKKLAKHWKFTEDHIRAIEHQYTGKQPTNLSITWSSYLSCDHREPELPRTWLSDASNMAAWRGQGYKPSEGAL